MKSDKEYMRDRLETFKRDIEFIETQVGFLKEDIDRCYKYSVRMVEAKAMEDN